LSQTSFYGGWKNCVFSTKLSSFPAPTAPPKPSISNRYIGCFNDKSKRDLPKYMGVLGSTDQCLQKCKQAGFKYMGRQYYDQCWCGNDYGSYGSSSSCNNCLSQTSFYGGWKNCVFSTNVVCTEEDRAAETLLGPWPCCVGLSGDVCKEYIESKEGASTILAHGVSIMKPGWMYATVVDFKRVRIFVDDKGIVSRAPKRG